MARRRQPSRSQNRLQLARPDNRVYLGNILLDLIPIPLHQASGDHNPLGLAAGLVLHHLQNRVHRLLLGGVDKAARIDDNNLGVFRVRRQLRTVVVQHPHHHFGVDKILGAAERDEAHLRFSGGGNDGFENGIRHPSILLGFARFPLRCCISCFTTAFQRRDSQSRDAQTSPPAAGKADSASTANPAQPAPAPAPNSNPPHPPSRSS